MVLLFSFSCSQAPDIKDDNSEGDDPELIVKRRDDGSISSINQVIDGRIVHGLRITYYGDGKTIYSRQTFRYGVKHGPSIWYYKNGQVFKECTFKDGKKQGLSRVY